MSKKFFTADWHLFHNNIMDYCDRKTMTLKQMHQILVNNHNQLVDNDDEVWNLGDVSFMSA
jgi:calcineurin-like phosphoesterase family protein